MRKSLLGVVMVVVLCMGAATTQAEGKYFASRVDQLPMTSRGAACMLVWPGPATQQTPVVEHTFAPDVCVQQGRTLGWGLQFPQET